MSDILKGTKLNSMGYGIVPKLVMKDTSIDICAKAIFAYFCSYAGSGDTCFPSRDTICADLGISKDRLGKYLKQLVLAGYINVEQSKENGKYSQNIYTIYGEVLPPNKSCTENTDTGNTCTENLVTNINNINNNNLNINSIIDTSNLRVSKETKDFKELKKIYRGTPNFTAPTVEEVNAYCQEWGKFIEAEKFVDFYASKGWFVGKNKMKDWRAAVRQWYRRDKEAGRIYKPPKENETNDLDFIFGARQ